MEQRTLLHTDLSVSRAGFGTMTLGKPCDLAASGRLVDACIDHGINFFDTANMYQSGVAESMLGEILKGRRDRVILASKAACKMGPGPDEGGLSRAALLKALDDTLKRLQTDYLDLYYLHFPDWSVPLEETLEAMDQAVRAGKVRYPATSNFAGWQIVQALWISAEKGYTPPYVSQPMYNLLARAIETEYLPMCKQFGVSTIVYNPLAGGLLTGKQHIERPLPGTRFDNNQLYLNRYWHPAYFEAVDRLKAIADKAGRSLVDLSLSWILHHTAADCVILGASRMDQLEQNLAALEAGPLSADVVQACDAVWSNLRGITPNYNR
jgi:aryl-alcohol dehydrogenase-like predicted oxidoreductase